MTTKERDSFNFLMVNTKAFLINSGIKEEDELMKEHYESIQILNTGLEVLEILQDNLDIENLYYDYDGDLYNYHYSLEDREIKVNLSQKDYPEEFRIVEKWFNDEIEEEKITNTPTNEFLYFEVLRILKKYIKYDNEKHVIKMKPLTKSTKNFDYETLKDWLKL